MKLVGCKSKYNRKLKKKKKDEREENEYLRLLIHDNELKKLNLYDVEHRSYTKETKTFEQQCNQKSCESSNKSGFKLVRL